MQAGTVNQEGERTRAVALNVRQIRGVDFRMQFRGNLGVEDSLRAGC